MFAASELNLTSNACLLLFCRLSKIWAYLSGKEAQTHDDEVQDIHNHPPHVREEHVADAQVLAGVEGQQQKDGRIGGEVGLLVLVRKEQAALQG